MTDIGTGIQGLPDSVLIAPPGLDREQWLTIRRRGIGGSDIAAICGLDDYSSPYGLYLDKRGEISFDTDSEEAKWGRRLEKVVAAGWSEDTGIPLLPSPGTLANRRRPWMLANPDYLAGQPDSPAILEIKTRSAYQLDEWEFGVPDPPALQAQWYMAVTGAIEAYVAALLGGNTLRWHRLVRDQTLIDTLIEIADRFRSDVRAGRAPTPEGSAQTGFLLAALADPQAGREHHADAAAVLPLLARRAELKASRDPAAGELVRAVENQLIAELDSADTCLVDGEVAYTWRATRRFAEARFRRDHPKLFRQFQRPTTQLDIDALTAAHPQLASAYRVRQFKTATAVSSSVQQPEPLPSAFTTPVVAPAVPGG
jgi:putative phage-type endonuclease